MEVQIPSPVASATSGGILACEILGATGFEPSQHPALPALISAALLRASVGSTEASDSRLARFGRIDRSVERSPCARRCRRTDPRKTSERETE